MRAADRLPAMAALLVAGALACSAAAPPPPGDASATADSLEIANSRACEQSLARLDELLAASDGTRPAAGAALVEARLLRDEAIAALAAGDYELALILIEEAIASIEKASG